jgi:hypothetical protein
MLEWPGQVKCSGEDGSGSGQSQGTKKAARGFILYLHVMDRNFKGFKKRNDMARFAFNYKV